MNVTRNLPAVVRFDNDSSAWIAHCLEGDIVSTGDSFEEAIGDLPEAVLIVVEDALRAGLDPLPCRAPREDFELWAQICATGVPLTLAEAHGERDRIFATQIRLELVARTAGMPVPLPAPPLPLHIVWEERAQIRIEREPAAC